LPTIPSNYTPQPSFFTPPPGSSSSPAPHSSSAPAPVTKRVILSSDQSFSFNTKIISPYDRNPFLTEYEFSSGPGRKTLYVKFISDTNEELIFSSDIELKNKINPSDTLSPEPESSYDPNSNSDPDSVPNRSDNEEVSQEFDPDAAPTAPPFGTPQFTPAPTQISRPVVPDSPVPAQQTTQETNSAPSYYRSPSFERAGDVRNDTVYEEDRAQELITDLNESNEGYPEKDDGNFIKKIIDGVVHFFTNLIN
jgi:hypothetical protein